MKLKLFSFKKKEPTAAQEAKKTSGEFLKNMNIDQKEDQHSVEFLEALRKRFEERLDESDIMSNDYKNALIQYCKISDEIDKAKKRSEQENQAKVESYKQATETYALACRATEDEKKKMPIEMIWNGIMYLAGIVGILKYSETNLLSRLQLDSLKRVIDRFAKK